MICNDGIVCGTKEDHRGVGGGVVVVLDVLCFKYMAKKKVGFTKAVGLQR